MSQAVQPGPLATFLNTTLQRSLKSAVETANYTDFRPLLNALKLAMLSKVPVRYHTLNGIFYKLLPVLIKK
jgi:hypothetical protein